MRIAATGFVSEQAGSVASANALLLRALLEMGHEVTFFSKAGFVDPRPAVGEHAGFRFVDVVNRRTDEFRRRVQRISGVGVAACQWDAFCYNRALVRGIKAAHRATPFDLALWLGDYARGRVAGIPSVSFAQGPPGTDARSIRERRAVIKEVAGLKTYWKWRMLSALRLSRIGMPSLENTDHFIVGSSVSKRTLVQSYGISAERVSPLPYPIDLELFRPPDEGESREERKNLPLRVLWLGRIVPRKRLEVFLDGAAEAIRRGLDCEITIVGSIGFIPGYEKLIERFPYPERLTWKKRVERRAVPDLLRQHDVLAQPSDEENFGSSVAEAQACGLPVIVGATNGNADYLCSRDIHLSDDSALGFASALLGLAERKTVSNWGRLEESRNFAEGLFSTDVVANGLDEILVKVAA